MSSLAFYAAPIDNNDSSAGNTQIEKKKLVVTKLLKKEILIHLLKVLNSNMVCDQFYQSTKKFFLILVHRILALPFFVDYYMLQKLTMN